MTMILKMIIYSIDFILMNNGVFYLDSSIMVKDVFFCMNLITNIEKS